jgi:hypothetical protein
MGRAAKNAELEVLNRKGSMIQQTPMEENIMQKKAYGAYIVIGVLYVFIKVVFVAAGYLHLGAIAHGAIPAVLTILAGIVTMKGNTDGSPKTTWRSMLIILPLLVFVTTPLYMYLKQGDTWLTNGRLPVLVIYECLAIAQCLIALSIKPKDRPK